MTHHRRNIITHVIVLLLLGAIVNVAVAWGCAYWSMDAELYSSVWRSSGASSVSETERKWLSQFDPRFPKLLRAEEEWSYGDLTGFGFKKRDYFSLPKRFFERHPFGGGGGGTGGYVELVSTTSAGWPLRSLCAYDIHVQVMGAWDREYFNAIVVTREVDIGGPEALERPLPLRPTLPGFAINTIFYAAVLWMIFAFPIVLRRRRRIKRGLCPACAYPVGTSLVCTECGKSIKRSEVSSQKSAEAQS